MQIFQNRPSLYNNILKITFININTNLVRQALSTRKWWIQFFFQILIISSMLKFFHWQLTLSGCFPWTDKLSSFSRKFVYYQYLNDHSFCLSTILSSKTSAPEMMATCNGNNYIITVEMTIILWYLLDVLYKYFSFLHTGY